MTRVRFWLGAMLAIAAAFAIGLATQPASSGVRSTASTAVPTPAWRPDSSSTRDVPPELALRVDPPELRDTTLDQTVGERVQLGTRIQDIFTAEVRDEAWAVPLEHFFRPELEAFLEALVPDADDVAVECRETLCQLTFTVPADQLARAFSRQQALPVGQTMFPWRETIDGDDTRRRVGMHVSFGDERPSVDEITRAFRDAYDQRFASGLDAARAYFDATDAERAKAASR